MYRDYHHICILVKYRHIKFGIKLKNLKVLNLIKINSNLNLHGEILLIIYYIIFQILQQKIIKVNLMIIHGREIVNNLKHGKKVKQDILWLMLL